MTVFEGMPNQLAQLIEGASESSLFVLEAIACRSEHSEPSFEQVHLFLSTKNEAGHYGRTDPRHEKQITR
jgi:hypothetical protein